VVCDRKIHLQYLSKYIREEVVFPPYESRFPTKSNRGPYACSIRSARYLDVAIAEVFYIVGDMKAAKLNSYNLKIISSHHASRRMVGAV
jgi:hypothetical protein